MNVKKTIILLVILLISSSIFSQDLSKEDKIKQLKDICMSLRKGLEEDEGSKENINKATKKYIRFTDKYMFSDDFTLLHKKIIKGEKNILENDNNIHVFYVPNYFIELLERDSVSTTGEQLLEEWTRYINEKSNSVTKGGSKQVFRHDNFIIRKGESVTFELTVPKGEFSIMTISEPHTALSMRVLNKYTGENYLTENKKVAHNNFTFDKSTVLEVTIKNVSFKNASMALFCL